MEHKDLGDTEAARNKLDTVIFFINFHWRDTGFIALRDAALPVLPSALDPDDGKWIERVRCRREDIAQVMNSGQCRCKASQASHAQVSMDSERICLRNFRFHCMTQERSTSNSNRRPGAVISVIRGDLLGGCCGCHDGFSSAVE